MYNVKFMNEALKLSLISYKSNDVPVGCVIVENNKIIAKAYNKNSSCNNPLLHAEILAINEACTFLNSRYLDNCEMYVTLEPCLMCTGAIINSRIKSVYIGCPQHFTGCFSTYLPIVREKMYPNIPNYAFKDTISAYILKRFFRKIRKNK